MRARSSPNKILSRPCSIIFKEFPWINRPLRYYVAAAAATQRCCMIAAAISCVMASSARPSRGWVRPESPSCRVAKSLILAESLSREPLILAESQSPSSGLANPGVCVA